jgi:hypothetical protein
MTNPVHDARRAQMDYRRFDTLARAIGAIRSRRAVLTTLTGSVLAGAVGLADREAVAAGKHADAKCSDNSECASGRCLKYGRCKKNGQLTGKCRCSCKNDTQCGTGRICRRRACFSTCTASSICTNLHTCGGVGNCGCFSTTAQDTVCVYNQVICGTADCSLDTDCPAGYVCTVISAPGSSDCCTERACMPPCQAQSSQIPTTEP